MKATPADLTHATLKVAFIGGLAVAALWVMLPFLLGLIWAATIVVATWPLLEALESRLGGRRPAAAIMTVALLVIFLMPLAMAVVTITTHADQIAQWLTSVQSLNLPAAPDWLISLPFVGKKIAALWMEIASTGIAALKPYASQLFGVATRNLSTVGSALLHIAVTLVVSGILYLQGDMAAKGVRLFFCRLAGEQGDRAVVLAAQAVRGVALGVVVTAMAQSLLGGLGLALTGVPLAGPLSLLMFVLCLAQIGPIPVLLPAAGWIYWADNTGGAVLLVVITIAASTMDGFLRPYLIKKGADLPLLLIFAGVIGGLLSFGPIGIFIGPVVLAVTFRLLQEWIDDPSPKE